jgi:hypothetical protein
VFINIPKWCINNYVEELTQLIKSEEDIGSKKTEADRYPAKKVLSKLNVRLQQKSQH